MPWVLFAVSTIVVVLAGAKVARYGDQIAELTGLGRLWIGAVLVATATSLPELFTDVSAALLDAPDLAVGDLFGSNMANMLILGIIDLLHRQKRVWQQAAYEQTLIAALAMALTGFAGALILFESGTTHLGVGLGSVLLIIIYLLGMRVVYRQEDTQRRHKEQNQVVQVEKDQGAITVRHPALKRAIVGFSLAALAILVAAPLLATSANDIAEMTGVSKSYIGTSLLAVITSLPELVTALAAVRLGAFDLAVGNLFGSNAFNMAVIFIVDLAYRSGPVLSAVSPAHAITALWSMILMNIGLMGIIYRAEKRFWFIEPDSLLIVVTYAIGLWLLPR